VRFHRPPSRKEPTRKARDEKSIDNLVSIMNDAGNRNSHGDRLVHFIVLLAELLVAEKLRVHAFLKYFERREGEERRKLVWCLEQRKGLKNAIENAMKDTHGMTQRPI